MRGRVIVCSMMFVVHSLLGCGGEAGPPIPIYPVSGKLTYQGQPVVGADITFHNQEADRSAFGRTDDQGEYQLTTFSSNDGAVPGKSVVTITKFEPPPVASPVAAMESEHYVPPGMGQSTDPPRPKSSFPEKFGDAQTSGLIGVVNADGPNTINFDLK